MVTYQQQNDLFYYMKEKGKKSAETPELGSGETLKKVGERIEYSTLMLPPSTVNVCLVLT